MIKELIEEVKLKLEAAPINYIETLAGLVQTETKIDGVKKDGSTMKSYPVYCPLKGGCEPNKIEPLVPSKERKSLFYFERAGDTLYKGTSKGYSNFTADVWLVGWLNPRALGSENCSISAPIVTQLIRTFDLGYFNAPGAGLSKIHMRAISVKTKEKSIFQKYKLGKKFYHLLEFPYDYFAIRYQIDFSIHENCAVDFEATTPIVC